MWARVEQRIIRIVPGVGCGSSGRGVGAFTLACGVCWAASVGPSGVIVVETGGIMTLSVFFFFRGPLVRVASVCATLGATFNIVVVVPACAVPTTTSICIVRATYSWFPMGSFRIPMGEGAR